MDKAVVIVETRHIDVDLVINNHMPFLDKGWELVVFHGPHNGHIFEKLTKHRLNLGRDIDKNGYSDVLVSQDFWLSIPAEKILIFQHDSGLLRTGIEEFLEWDYVGAPWFGGIGGQPYPLSGGNGGLSLRTRSVMLNIVRNRAFVNGWMASEDFYFSRHVPEFGRLAPREVCKKFSCEMAFEFGTLGYHGLEKYLNKFSSRAIKMQYIKNGITENFDEEYYLGTYPDVKAAVESKQYQSGLSHFIQYGIYENRCVNRNNTIYEIWD